MDFRFMYHSLFKKEPWCPRREIEAPSNKTETMLSIIIKKHITYTFFSLFIKDFFDKNNLT